MDKPSCTATRGAYQPGQPRHILQVREGRQAGNQIVMRKQETPQLLKMMQTVMLVTAMIIMSKQKVKLSAAANQAL